MITNETIGGKIYYGLHFCSGLAEYQEKDGAYRIYLNEDTIRSMNPTFAGKPVYVQHVDQVNMENLRAEADGFVVESFYNAADSKTWVKFLVVSDKGHEALRMGWRLSNAYIPKSFAAGGVWNGITYQKEVTQAEYDHLAIVKNPRYAESVILTPEQFKQYNEDKELALKRVANSNDKGEKSVFNFFKKTKMENSADLEQTSVMLPKSKVELTITQLIEQCDAVHNMHGYANPEHMVKAGEEEMSVNDMVSKYCAMKEDMEKAKNEKDMGEKKAEEDKKEADKTENKDDGEKKAEEDGKKADPEKKENDFESGVKEFDALKNAPLEAIKNAPKVDLDKAARGKKRYGSN